MSFDSKETSVADGKPFELYLFQGTGIEIAVTSSDQVISYISRSFKPSTISRSEAKGSDEVEAGQTTVYVPKNDPIAKLFIKYLPVSKIALTIFGGHYGDSEVGVLFSGDVSSSHFDDQAELICNSDQYKMQTKIPRIAYQSSCPHIFGSPGCGQDLGAATYAGVVTAISDDGEQITIPDFAGLPHPFKAGFLTVGNEKRAIVDQGGSGSSFFVVLITAISDLEVGSDVLGTAGCQQTYPSCETYGRIASFLGFDLIPIKNPYDGSIS
jgi:hypothetical protein